jgi:hypothetical protein
LWWPIGEPAMTALLAAWLCGISPDILLDIWRKKLNNFLF